MSRAEGERIAVARAKGRPMLSWVGKRPLREVQAFPSQLVERFAPETPAGVVAEEVDWSDWPDRFDRGALLFHGDNKEVLAHLLATGFRGKVDLVYIDPPFDSGADYVRKVQLRGASGSARLDGETYTLGEQIQYTDIWANDTYLQFMYERLLLIKELITTTGSIYLHCDWRRVHHLLSLLGEVFGDSCLRNVITWKRAPNLGRQAASEQYGRNTDFILYFSVSPDVYFDPPTRLVPLPRGNAKWDDERERWFTTAPRGDYTDESIKRLEAEGRVYRSKTGSISIKYFLEEIKDELFQRQRVDSFWGDVPPLRHAPKSEDLDFETQKPEALLSRIIGASCPPGGLVLDCFIGSGTTAAVAQKLGRRWIGADINKGAIQTTEKRLAAIIREQIAASGEQLTLDGDPDRPARPAQLSFTVRRVNDYDLQIQHNEALELAVEHLGVQRTRADTFFHGTLGRELVYIVPFDHPATVLDLQAVVRELEARPGEERDVVVVGLGRELSTVAWLETHNRHRPVNKVRLIDLRTDEKHGRFFEHRPATARVSFERADGCLRVRVNDVISPSILERLAGQEGVLAPQIDDWRAMVDSVAIDTAYDGTVFDVDHIDIPERRTDLVAGTYELDAPDGDRPAAVRITDMLGEEILVLEERAIP